MSDAAQLEALGRLDALFEARRIQYWLFGGWAVDFHVGAPTRAHDDLDLAVWHADYERIDALLRAKGWTHTPEEHEDGYTVYEHGPVRLELAFLARDEQGRVRGDWPDGAFEDDVRELLGVRARVVTLAALAADKSVVREDPRTVAKDHADVAALRALHRRRSRA